MLKLLYEKTVADRKVVLFENQGKYLLDIGDSYQSANDILYSVSLSGVYFSSEYLAHQAFNELIKSVESRYI